VRNRRDGTVEAVFAGSIERVEAAIEASRKGPRAAVVEAVDQREAGAHELALRGVYGLFVVLPTV
jgi:acylphosphatase